MTPAQSRRLLFYAERYLALLVRLDDPKRESEIKSLRALVKACQNPETLPPHGMYDKNGNVR